MCATRSGDSIDATPSRCGVDRWHAGSVHFGTVRDAAEEPLVAARQVKTVAPGYAGYTGWLAAGLFAHSFTVMVSTNALLSGFFAEMSAASWLMKDLLPPLLAGTLASRIRTLEANPKKWLGAACFANSLLGGTECRVTASNALTLASGRSRSVAAADGALAVSIATTCGVPTT